LTWWPQQVDAVRFDVNLLSKGGGGCTPVDFSGGSMLEAGGLKISTARNANDGAPENQTLKLERPDTQKIKR
jgi:hypothetical protein